VNLNEIIEAHRISELLKLFSGLTASFQHYGGKLCALKEVNTFG
jgi:hypothetical protein